MNIFFVSTRCRITATKSSFFVKDIFAMYRPSQIDEAGFSHQFVDNMEVSGLCFSPSLYLDVVVGVVASTGITPISGKIRWDILQCYRRWFRLPGQKRAGYHGFPTHPNAS